MFCLDCSTRNTCNKICKELEKELPKPQSGIDGKKIKFYDPILFDKLFDSDVRERPYIYGSIKKDDFKVPLLRKKSK